MEYRYCRQKHPEWPKRLKEAIGRHGIMQHEITNKAGTTFKAGTVVKITHTWRGKLVLRQAGTEISRVGLGMIELLPEGN